MIVETANSTYTFANGRVKRTNHAGNELRRDEEELKLIRLVSPPVVGQPMQMYIVVRADGTQTLRVTSPVVRIQS